jgi:hypothetical protein
MTKLRVLVLCFSYFTGNSNNIREQYGERYEGTKPLNPKEVLQNIFVRGCGDRWESRWLGECGDAAAGCFCVCVCAGRAGREEEEEDNSNHTPHL